MHMHLREANVKLKYLKWDMSHYLMCKIHYICIWLCWKEVLQTSSGVTTTYSFSLLLFTYIPLFDLGQCPLPAAPLFLNQYVCVSICAFVCDYLCMCELLCVCVCVLKEKRFCVFLRMHILLKCSVSIN